MNDMSQASPDGSWISNNYEPGLVSVIIPTFNRAQMALEAMDSVFAQTYRPIELIVVDDGSTDNTAEAIEEWSGRCSDDSGFNLRYIHQENRGAPAARNRGAAESRGEFILWHDSDDIMYPRRIEIAINRLLDQKADICGCGNESDTGRIGMPPAKVSRDSFDSLISLPVGTHMWIYRRSFLAGRRPWEDVKPFDDAVFFRECIFREPRPSITTVRQKLYLQRSHAGSRLTGDHGASRVAFETRLDYCERRLSELAEEENDNDYLRRAITVSLCAMAVETWRRFPDIYKRINKLIDEYGKGTAWGRTWFHRLLWRAGGPSACAVYMRIRRLQYPFRKIVKRMIFRKPVVNNDAAK